MIHRVFQAQRFDHTWQVDTLSLPNLSEYAQNVENKMPWHPSWFSTCHFRLAIVATSRKYISLHSPSYHIINSYKLHLESLSSKNEKQKTSSPEKKKTKKQGGPSPSHVAHPPIFPNTPEPNWPSPRLISKCPSQVRRTRLCASNSLPRHPWRNCQLFVDLSGWMWTNDGRFITKFQGFSMEFLRKLFGQFIIFPCLNMSEYVWMSWELHT